MLRDLRRRNLAAALSNKLMRRTGYWAVSLEYSLPQVLRQSDVIISRIEYTSAVRLSCPSTCDEPGPMDRLFPCRYRYELRDVVADTHTGHLMISWLGARSLVQESTAWPAYQVGGVKLPGLSTLPVIPGRTAVAPSTRNYFHWLTEDLPALVRLGGDPAVDQVLIGKNAPPFVHQATQLVGITPTEAPRFVRLERAVLYGKSQDVGWMNPEDADAVRFIADKVPRKEASADRALFIGRSGYSRTFEGESRIGNDLSAVGVMIFDPGSHSLSDQIRAFSGANLVVGFHGAGLAGIAFSEPGRTLIEIVRPDYANRCYEWLCHTFGLRYQAVYEPLEVRAYAEAVLGT
jgi:capsular polysaccharide biosynthesis protein